MATKLIQSHPQGYGMSVKCEEPIDELTVQVWLLYHHPNFNYWTLFVSRTELRTNGQTDGRTDDLNTRCPRRTFQAGGIKSSRVHRLIRLDFTNKINQLIFGLQQMFIYDSTELCLFLSRRKNVHVPLSYTKSKSLHLRCLKYPASNWQLC